MALLCIPIQLVSGTHSVMARLGIHIKLVSGMQSAIALLLGMTGWIPDSFSEAGVSRLQFGSSYQVGACVCV